MVSRMTLYPIAFAFFNISIVLECFYRVELFYGFKDEMNIPMALEAVYQAIEPLNTI